MTDPMGSVTLSHVHERSLRGDERSLRRAERSLETTLLTYDLGVESAESAA
jgi:hypothetical protein